MLWSRFFSLISSESHPFLKNFSIVLSAYVTLMFHIFLSSLDSFVNILLFLCSQPERIICIIIIIIIIEIFTDVKKKKTLRYLYKNRILTLARK